MFLHLLTNPPSKKQISLLKKNKVALLERLTFWGYVQVEVWN